MSEPKTTKFGEADLDIVQIALTKSPNVDEAFAALRRLMKSEYDRGATECAEFIEGVQTAYGAEPIKPSVSEFMEKQFADPEIKAVYERLAKR